MIFIQRVLLKPGQPFCARLVDTGLHRGLGVGKVIEIKLPSSDSETECLPARWVTCVTTGWSTVDRPDKDGFPRAKSFCLVKRMAPSLLRTPIDPADGPWPDVNRLSNFRILVKIKVAKAISLGLPNKLVLPSAKTRPPPSTLTQVIDFSLRINRLFRLLGSKENSFRLFLVAALDLVVNEVLSLCH